MDDPQHTDYLLRRFRFYFKRILHHSWSREAYFGQSIHLKINNSRVYFSLTLSCQNVQLGGNQRFDQPKLARMHYFNSEEVFLGE